MALIMSPDELARLQPGFSGLSRCIRLESFADAASLPPLILPPSALPLQPRLDAAAEAWCRAARQQTIGPPLILPPNGITWVDRTSDEPIRAIAGDSDGPLVPLPAKPNPVRVPPPFPRIAYQALTR